MKPRSVPDVPGLLAAMIFTDVVPSTYSFVCGMGEDNTPLVFFPFSIPTFAKQFLYFMEYMSG